MLRRFTSQSTVEGLGAAPATALAALPVGARGVLLAAQRFRATRFRLEPEVSAPLIKMLYHEHYTPKSVELQRKAAAESVRLGAPVISRDGLYEAKTELGWICEWANANGKHEDEKSFRRAVQLAVLERVDLHKPLAYVVGTQPFYGCEVRCVAPLLIPRTETEEWTCWFANKYLRGCVRGARDDVNEADDLDADKRRKKGAITTTAMAFAAIANPRPPLPAADATLRILDMCCGTGCVGSGLMKHFPGVQVVGVDIDPLAVKTAAANYAAHSQGGFAPVPASLTGGKAVPPTPSPQHDGPRFQVFQSDMFKSLPDELRGSFDVIVANPPYILKDQWDDELEHSVKNFENRLALVGDENHEHDPLSYYKELRDEAPKWLAPTVKRCPRYRGPRLVSELGLQSHVMQKLFLENPAWSKCDLHLDRFENPRWIEAFF